MVVVVVGGGAKSERAISNPSSDVKENYITKKMTVKDGFVNLIFPGLSVTGFFRIRPLGTPTR